MNKKLLIIFFVIIVAIYVCIRLFTDIQLPSGLLRMIFLSLLIVYFVIKKSKENNYGGNTRI